MSPKGLKKLNQAKVQLEIEQNFKRYTLEALSEKTNLTPTTLSKIFIGSARVDKRTLECCFSAFNLSLQKEDYCYLECQKVEVNDIHECSMMKNCSSHCQATFLQQSSYQNSFLKTYIMNDNSNNFQISSFSLLGNIVNNNVINSLNYMPTLPGGVIPIDSNFYIHNRTIESFCHQALEQPGILLKIRASKQMGKTSLVNSLLTQAKTLGYHTVFLNLQLADVEILQNLERFMQWFCVRVSKQLSLPNAIANFWDHSLGSKSNATDYFEEILLANIERPLIIAIDELSQLFAYPDIASEFLSLLRVWSEQAKTSDIENNPWHNLRLITIHSTEMAIPICLNQSLLNTELVINLPEFTLLQVQELANRWGLTMTIQQIKSLMDFLGGHPYRLQLAFYRIQQQEITLEQLLENVPMAIAIYEEHLQQHWWNLQNYPELLPIFTEIVNNTNYLEIETSQGIQLQNMGLIHLKANQANICCELFRQFFQKIGISN